MKRTVVLGWVAALATGVSVLVACGGGADSGGATGSTQLEGTVLSASAQGAPVFLDLNNNQALDAGEPNAAVGAGGAFSLEIGGRTAGELASAMLVAEIPQSALGDGDAGLTLQDAGRGAYRLMAPAAAFVHVDKAGRQKTSRAVVSPLTTLVAAEVTFNGLTPEQGAQAVRKHLGLGDKDPLGDYRADAGLQNIARAAAIALGEARAPSSQRIRAQLKDATTELKASLPAVIKDLNLATGAQSSVSVAAVKQSVAAVKPQVNIGATVDALAATGNRFIVRFRDSVRDPAERGQALASASRAELRHTYARAIKGFAVTVPADAVQSFLEAALQDADVDHVEADQAVHTLQTVQSNATWGLDRTDQRALPLSTTYSYFSNGSGVRAYIIDTGIRSTHQDIRGRVAAGFTAISDGKGTTDCHGHGTHVSGTVGGKTWGMAKGVTLVPVRVLDCQGSGTTSGVIAGIEWVVAHAVRPAVANMSLGGSSSQALNDAVAAMVDAGITVSVAAGNSNLNACDSSPASEPSAITVGATGSDDVRAWFSNYGTCVDVFAPGVNITSAGISSDSSTAVMSGTSMAAPHVTGLVALYLQGQPSASPATVVAAIKASASTGKVVDGGAGSPDALIYTDLSSVEPPPEPPVSSPEPPISSPEPPISSPEPPPPPSVSVAALSGNSWMDGTRGWRATVTIAVKNATGDLVPGAVVKGNFTVGGSKLSCTTAPNGTCSINSGKISLKVLQTQFSVTSIVSGTTPYNAALNAKTSVVIAKP